MMSFGMAFVGLGKTGGPAGSLEERMGTGGSRKGSRGVCERIFRVGLVCGFD